MTTKFSASYSPPPAIVQNVLPRAVSRLTMRTIAIAVVVALHIVVIGFVTAVAAFAHWGPPRNAIFSEAILFTTLALIMAYCSLTALWWAQTTWPSHLKTLVAVIAAAGTWACLLAVLTYARGDSEAAAAWAASFALQALLTAILAMVIEQFVQRNRAKPSSRYSLSFLFIWMTVVAIVLAGGRWLFGLFHWRPESFGAAEFVVQLQAIAVANSLLTVRVFACSRMPQRTSIRVLICLCAVLLFAAASAGSMFAIFGSKFGATFFEYGWLMIGEGMFLAATLFPLEMARDNGNTYQSSAATSNGLSSAACSAGA